MTLRYLWIFFFNCILHDVSCNPNFVFILTDDQDLLLNGMVPMKKAIKLIADRGKTFQNAFVNTPICCPSRSSILTGRYAHNTGVVNNSISGGCSSKNWQDVHEPNSMAAILKKEKNYVSFYAGKYLNKYGSKEVGGTRHIPVGYDWWIGLKGNSKYYNYTLSINGSATSYRDDYLTDVLANYSLSFLENRPSNRPFFMIIATPACHAPFTPAKRHEYKFKNVKALRNPSFNYSSYDKHWIVQMPPKTLPEDVRILDDIQKHRMQSLLAVDEMIARIIGKLQNQNVLDNTYIIFTSDNGFHIGQFSQPWDKRQPYETDIRVPLLISGPKIPRKTLEDFPVAAIDLAPTVLDLAEIDVTVNMDGQSFKKILFSKKVSSFRKYVFVEYWGEGNDKSVDPECQWKYDEDLSECSADNWCKCQDSRNNTYTCVLDISNAGSFKFCRFQDKQHFIEAYNLTEDPYELRNIANSIDYDLKLRYSSTLNKFKKQ